MHAQGSEVMVTVGGMKKKEPVPGDVPNQPQRNGGWALVGTATKWHWFLAADGRSLCKNWLKLSKGGTVDNNHNSPDNCKMCSQLRKQW
jgi:hypothetical protein